MACTLLIRGGNIELSPVEAFTKVKRRVEAAKQNRLDYTLGNSEKFNDGVSTEMMFLTDLGLDDDENQMTGRIFVDVAEVIGVMSDEYKDRGGVYKPAKDEDDDEE